MNARPAPPTVPPPRFRRGPVIAGIAVAIALVLGGWGLWRGLAGGAGDEATPAQDGAGRVEGGDPRGGDGGDLD